MAASTSAAQQTPGLTPAPDAGDHLLSPASTSVSNSAQSTAAQRPHPRRRSLPTKPSVDGPAPKRRRRASINDTASKPSRAKQILPATNAQKEAEAAEDSDEGPYCLCGSANDGGKYIQCDLQSATAQEPQQPCAIWYHLKCVGIAPRDLAKIAQYHCARCTNNDGNHRLLDTAGAEISPHTRRSGTQIAYDMLDSATSSGSTMDDPEKWTRMLELCTRRGKIVEHAVPVVPASHVTAARLSQSPLFSAPFAVTESPLLLGMNVPEGGLTVEDIASSVGHDFPVEVIDVATQSSLGMPLGRFAALFVSPRRHQILNVISLEFSTSSLADRLARPLAVRELDLVNRYWPPDRRNAGDWPRVQNYLLMGMAGSYTDFHIDFAGTSVFYHVMRGAKTFYFIPPTVDNLGKYAAWLDSDNDASLALSVDRCLRVTVTAGSTLFIPSGWIHAVYTPEDATVYGGNFLHCGELDKQLCVHQLELGANIDSKFLFPNFNPLMWYTLAGLFPNTGSNTEWTPPPACHAHGVLAVAAYLTRDLAQPKGSTSTTPTSTSTSSSRQKRTSKTTHYPLVPPDLGCAPPDLLRRAASWSFDAVQTRFPARLPSALTLVRQVIRTAGKIDTQHGVFHNKPGSHRVRRPPQAVMTHVHEDHDLQL
ncbi:hypothetical protein BC828DRAFT_393319 [Blastocladiella britannica]|nr:hypothetical protein BC828DRAFT_393319 [Blastocladiella britannica]